MKDHLDFESVHLSRCLFDAFAGGDLSQWESKLAPGFTFSYPGMPDGKGVADARAYNAPFVTAFSDWIVDVHSAAVDGENVFQAVTVNATHSGPLQTPQGILPATGRRGAVKCVIYTKVRGGKLAHEATYWNVLDLIGQLTN